MSEERDIKTKEQEISAGKKSCDYTLASIISDSKKSQPLDFSNMKKNYMNNEKITGQKITIADYNKKIIGGK